MNWCRVLWTAGAVVVGATAHATGHAEETVGPHTIIAAPVSAVLVSGGGASFNWLNVVNAPVSINEAFTGFSVVDDGYANAQSGTTLRMTFGPGVVRNNDGPDLVLLDAGNDLNQYRVRASHDGFLHEILVNASADTGVDRTYFFGGQGPTKFDVFAGTIDLSALAVSLGQTVDQVQLFTEGPSNDPLALGVLAPACSAPTGHVVGLRVLADKMDLGWDPPVSAVSYDVVKGDLAALHGSGGDFTASLAECLENGSTDTHSFDAALPSPGGAFYYLVRYQDPCDDHSTYDSGSAAQQGSSDAEIARSSFACIPAACPGPNPAIGHCGTNEDCFQGVCSHTGCTPAICYCSPSGQWICASGCLGHCV